MTGPETEALLEKAHRYQQSAHLLLSAGDYDSAASRLYYAMFYCAEALLLSKDLRYTSHRGVISGFGEHLVKTGELPAETHRWLREAFDMRQEADYRSTSRVEEEDVRELDDRPRDFLTEVEKYLSRGEP